MALFAYDFHSLPPSFMLAIDVFSNTTSLARPFSMMVADAKASHHESSEKTIGNTIANTEKRKKCRTPEDDHRRDKTYLREYYDEDTVRISFLHTISTRFSYISPAIYVGSFSSGDWR